MSGRRAKAERRAARARAPHIVNAQRARASAERILAVDISDVPPTHANQVAIGWLRALFEQSRVVATLTEAGLAHAAGPNRRLAVELILRIQWFSGLRVDQREAAVDTMLDAERENVLKTLEHARQMGWDIEADTTEMREFVLDVTDDGPLKDQARKLASAVHATELKSAELYRFWRDETNYAHASAISAGAHAPAEDHLVAGSPPVFDADLEAHRLMTVLAVSLVYGVLVDGGTPEHTAMRLVHAFFGT